MAITAADVRDQDADPRREDQHLAEALEIERAKATTAPEVRCDGGESDHAELRECETKDDDNVHAKGNLEQKKIAEAELEREPIDVGDHVQDRDDPDSTMVVVRLDTMRADAYELGDGGPTVAEVNPEYPPKDDVVEVVFPNRTDLDIDKKRYAYPESRLEVVARVHDRDDDQEVSE